MACMLIDRRVGVACVLIDRCVGVACVQEAEQKRLELEMQKRRERIEAWRAARKAKQDDSVGVAGAGEQTAGTAEASRKWTLEDEAEDEDADSNDVTVAQNGDVIVPAEDIDPLDAYMQVVVSVI